MRPILRGLCAALLASQLTACAPLVVGGAATGVAVVHDRRSSGVVLDDQRIELRFKDLVWADNDFDDAHINVTSYNQALLLTGEVPTRDIGLKAAEFARGIDKVRMVHNELVIAPPSSLLARSNDGLITTGVKTALLAVDQPGFDPTRVKVVTEAGVVYLLGLVYNAEADAATERARNVSGVRKVVRLFEYLD